MKCGGIKNKIFKNSVGVQQKEKIEYQTNHTKTFICPALGCNRRRHDYPSAGSYRKKEKRSMQ